MPPRRDDPCCWQKNSAPLSILIWIISGINKKVRSVIPTGEVHTSKEAVTLREGSSETVEGL